MKHFPKYRNVALLFLVIVAISVIIVFAQSQLEYYRVTDEVRIVNKSDLFVVESITEFRNEGIKFNSKNSEEQRKFEIKLRNGYEKPIVYYSLLIKDALTEKNKTVTKILRGGLIDDWSIQPNKTDVNYFDAEPKGEVILTIAAVLFEDGTGVGDPAELVALQGDKAGIKLGYQKIVPLIRQHLIQNEAVDSKLAIQTLQEDISSISKNDVPMDQLGGFLQVKQYILNELNDLKNNLNSDSDLAYKSKLAEHLASIEARIAKL